MIHLVKKIYVNMWSIVTMLTLCTSSTLQADPLTPTELHATMGIVTNFILSDTQITHNGTEYGTVISPYTGKVWLDRNLGATQVCTSFDDVACYGDYYQWGRNADGHEKSNSNYIATLADNVTNVGHGDFITSSGISHDWASVDLAGVERTTNWTATDGSSACPVGFRVPILAELKAELLDIGSAQITNNTDAFNSFLKLPSPATRGAIDGSIQNLGLYGNLWSSSASGNTAYYLYFDSGSGASYNDYRALGISVRCIKN